MFGYPGLDAGLNVIKGILVSTLKEYNDFCGGASPLEDVVKKKLREMKLRIEENGCGEICSNHKFKDSSS